MTRVALLFIALLVAFCSTAAFCAETTSTANADTPKIDTAPPAAQEVKVSISLSDAKPSEIVESLAKQAKNKILLESTAKAKVTLSLEDIPLENALSAFCKAGKFEWRKVYLDPESKLLEQPDRLAATVRLVSGMGFPDLIVSGSSTKKVAIYSEGEKAVKEAESKLVKDLGLSPVYLITNDAAVAAKKTEEEDKDSKAVDDYIDGTKKLMDQFMNMTPEEREDALIGGINLMDQMGPDYMSSVMQTMLNSDPALLKQMVGRQTQMLFSMDETARRRMLRLNMEATSMLTPEQLEMLKEDQKAAMEEMRQEHGN